MWTWLVTSRVPVPVFCIEGNMQGAEDMDNGPLDQRFGRDAGENRSGTEEESECKVRYESSI